VGRWLAANGEAIYGAASTPLGPELVAASGPRWRCTRKPGTLYATLFSWPGSEAALDLPGYDVTRATLLGDAARRPLRLRKEGSRVHIELGGTVRAGEMPVLRLEHAAP
jgi:hypothetical protein